MAEAELTREVGVVLGLETGPSLSHLVTLGHRQLGFLPSQFSRALKCLRQESKPGVHSLSLLRALMSRD